MFFELEIKKHQRSITTLIITSFTSLFVLLLNVVYPVWIAPLFNTFAPLPEGDVRDGVEALVKSSGINCSRIFQVDGSPTSGAH